MAIVLLGATGRTGSLVLIEALKRGHNVTALVRNPSSLDSVTSTLEPAQKANLTVVRGSPLNASDISNAVTTASTKSGKLVVISTLNSRRTSENPWAAPHPTDSPPRMMADSVANVLSAIKGAPAAGAAERPKVIHVSAIGVGPSVPNAHWVLRTLISHSNIKLTYEDHGAVEEELKAAQGVDWVVVRPGRLTEGDDGNKAKVWPAEKGMVGFTSKISRGAVAKFVVDASEGSEWDGKDPIILS